MSWISKSIRRMGVIGGQVAYDDLQSSVSMAKLPAANAPAWTAITLGGLATEVLAFEVNDYVDLFIQSNHSVKLSTILDNHIHWTLGTDENGKKFQFQLTGCAAPIGGTFTSIGTISSGDYTLASNAGKHNYFEVGHLPAINTTVSSLYIVRLKRIAAADAANETARLIYVIFNDNHVEMDRFGSLSEATKA